MEEFKRRHFETAHPGDGPLDIRALASEQCREVQSRLIARLRLPRATVGLVLLQTIADRSKPIENENAAHDDFKLDRVVWRARIKPQEWVYINWYRFDRIDQIKYLDLVRYFDDIWYPGPDDISIFDEECHWIISVDHEGGLAVLKL